MNRLTFFLAALAMIPLALLPAGCQKRRAAKERQPFERPAIDNHLTVVVDVSGSFRGQLERDGRPFLHLTQAVGAYFQAGAGEARNDRLVLAVISGNSRSILFDGTPREFQDKYGSATALQRCLLAYPDAGGSRVFDTIHEVIGHALGTEGCQPGKTRLTLLVLSDMENTVVADSKSGERMSQSMRQFATAGGVVGLHWVPQKDVAAWRDYLLKSGFSPSRSCVTPDFQPSVPLPGF